MNSNQREAMVHLSRITEALDDPRLAAVVDVQVDDATETYKLAHAPPVTGKSFNKEIADFVLHVCRNSEVVTCIPSLAEAFSLAVDSLEYGYGGHTRGGYAHGILDAVEGNASIDAVLTWIAESMKNRQRQTYRMWVISKYIDGLDWVAKRTLAALVIELNGECGDGHLAAAAADRLADHVTELVEAHLAAIAAIRNAKPRTLAV